MTAAGDSRTGIMSLDGDSSRTGDSRTGIMSRLTAGQGIMSLGDSRVTAGRGDSRMVTAGRDNVTILSERFVESEGK